MLATIHGASISCFVYTMEILSAEMRTPLGIMLNIFGAFGFMTMSLLAMVTYHWFDISLMISFYPLMMCFVFPFIPESYRWYFSKGRFEEGARTLESFSKRCGRQIHPETIDRLRKQNSPEELNSDKIYTMVDLFRYPNTRLTTFKMAYIWFATMMTYYVLCLQEMPGFLPVNNIINGVMEMAIIPLAFISRKSWCRRSIVSGICLIIGGVIIIICALLELLETEEADMTSRCLSFIGRAIMSILVALMYIYSAEIYPTVVRNCGLGFCSIFGRIGAMLGPQIIKFSNMPGIIIGLITLLGGVIR